MSTLRARPLVRSKVPAQALALTTFHLAEIICIRVHAEEPDERVQLSNAVLQRSASQAPLHRRLERIDALCGVGRASLYLVSLVKDDSVPINRMK